MEEEELLSLREDRRKGGGQGSKTGVAFPRTSPGLGLTEQQVF